MEAPWCAESCCELSSTQGKQLFRAALLEGTAECYLRLAEVFYTQSEPAFCGLGTLVMVLNALEVDPGALWKGNWRWYDESMFGCCVDLEEVKKNGITWRPWCSLARAQGLHLTPKLAVNTTIDDFRDTVRAVTASDGDRVLVVNYSRRGVGQVGTGHFSPVGAFVAEHDMVLVLDVARFKHPPHFLPLETLWHAMSQKDPVTGFARAALVTLREALPAGAPAEERAHFEQSRAELACTRVHRALSEAAALFRTRDGPLPASIDVCAVLLLVLNAIVPEPQLRQALPRTASWLLEEPLLAHGNALAEDVSCMRGLLEDMAREMGDTWLGATPDLALSPPKAAPPLPVPRDASAATGGHAPVTPPSLCVV